jgi:hypothetical protein
VDRIFEEIKRQMPEGYARLSEVKSAMGKQAYAAVLDQIWTRVAKQTIDYGVFDSQEQI